MTDKSEFRALTPQEVGKLVKMFRTNMGWKQLTLAYEAGITERTVQRIEEGVQVSEDTRRQVAKALAARGASSGFSARLTT